MNYFIRRVALTLMVVSLASVSVLAKTQSEKITFIDDIKINGTLVAKGAYKLKFDDKTGEVSILKGSKVIARATATTAKRNSKSQTFEWRYSGSGDDQQLTGITFRGADHDVVISNSSANR